MAGPQAARLHHGQGCRPRPAGREPPDVRGDPPRVRADFFRCTRGWDLRGALASVTIPAVVLHGEGDKVIDIDLAEILANALPDARFEKISDTGHMLPLERPLLAVSAVAELASR
ncbi:alpha/beta fold hydrolase [Streptomyces nojiriensis]